MLLIESTYRKVAGLVAVVAAAVGTVHTQGRAVSLDMAEALAVVALLSWKSVRIGMQRLYGEVPYSRWYEDEGKR